MSRKEDYVRQREVYASVLRNRGQQDKVSYDADHLYVQAHDGTCVSYGIDTLSHALFYELYKVVAGHGQCDPDAFGIVDLSELTNHQSQYGLVILSDYAMMFGFDAHGQPVDPVRNFLADVSRHDGEVSQGHVLITHSNLRSVLLQKPWR